MSETRDIVIYMNDEDFLHKTHKDIIAWWSMSRIPKYFSEAKKIFFAHHGQIVGYVQCDEFNPEDSIKTLVWRGKTFQYIKPIACQPFRGFRYRWFKPRRNR